MSHFVLGDHGDLPHTLKYIITHVFCPLGLPESDDHSIENDHSLAKAIATTTRFYARYVDQANLPQWHIIMRMLENLQAMTQAESLDTLQAISQFSSMHVGDILAMPIRAQNAGVIFRKQKDVTIFEAFELSPMAKDVMATEGRLICSYPGPAIEIPNSVFHDKDFLSELVNFIVHMNHDRLDATDQTSRNEEQDKSAFKDTFHPHYITGLLTGILRSAGRPTNITRISKRVGDDVIGNSSKPPWRRSSLWLLIRVSLQTTLDQSPLGHDTYKQCMLFFMCCLAQEEASADLASDLLQFMSTKISRRLQKLGSFAPDWLSQTVVQTCTSLRSTIETRWKKLQAQRVSPPWSPSQLDLTRDVQLSLLRTGDYLRNTLPSHSVKAPDVPFGPRHRPRGTLDDFLSSDADFIDEAYRLEPHVTLYDIEQAVEQGIDAWVDRVTNNEEACSKLDMLADNYSSRALKTYANNPELLSVMLLTTIELWIALDKIAIKETPMLVDYSPEVPTSVLEHLLLCKTASLRRLRRANEYLSCRYLQSRSTWSVFSSTTTADSFAVRFYRKSPHLQYLKSHIEKIAQDEVRDKAAELQEISMNAHLSPYDPIRISVHEWPLPANKLQAEAVVFELDCPKSFNIWRTATFRFLVDLCSPSVQQDVPFVQLNNYHALQWYFVEHPRSRISLGPKTSAFMDTLYIPAKRKDVCLKNGLSFYAFDTRTGIPVSEALGRHDSREHCTYKLPRGPYQNLQKYVDFTSHTSNEVVANQVDCHRELFIHEYMAFGHLRSGGLLQWLNILRELRSRSLCFRRPEVHMLLAQAASEVGPFSDTEWTWHQEIQQPAFCHALLGELRSLIRDVEANWLEAVAMDTISFLLRRLLVSSPDEAVSMGALDLLRTVRDKVFSWVEELFSRTIKTTGDEGCREILRDTAAICRSTFDVDPEMVSKLLCSPKDIEILLSSAMIIQDLRPNDVCCLPAYSQIVLHRDRRLSLALENVLSDVIQADSTNQGINLAVGRIWSAYRVGSKWTVLPLPNSRWFSCTTAPLADKRLHTVHFNILDGSLLVDGKPFGNWLPNEFVRNSLYKIIFGEQMLKVIPSDIPGMDYSTRSLISNHQVYFSLRNHGSDLVIRAKLNRREPGDSEIIELIPHGKLEGDLPTVLIEGYAHWLNLSTFTIEIRPLNNLWEASSENWKINCTPGNYRMWKGHEFLVDFRSQSWDMVSNLLRPLGTPQDLIVSISPVNSNQPTPWLRLSVFFPRYDLSFYVDSDGDLQSGDMRGMVYDMDQSIGTLFGLVNQLVLRPKVNNPDATELAPRCILIPDGDVSFRVEGHHVRVEITPTHSILKRITYQTYTINIDLGCLIGDYSLTSKLYLAYLHALTSGCSVDPLTGRSGTEEALSILRSARCWSSTKFDSRDAELLSSIASICPLRTWHVEQSVQKVEWLDLPKLSQNHDLYTTCRAIKEHYERRRLFCQSQSSQSFPLRDDHLLKRSAQRAAHLLPLDFSGLLSTTDIDIQYAARDAVNAAPGEHRAYIAATYVRHRTTTNIKDMDIWNMLRSSIMEVSTENILSLRYNSSWLAPNIPMIWLTAYNLLRQPNQSDKWSHLLFSLPAMAYTSSHFSELVPVFIAFASYPQFRFEDPPKYEVYPIVEGCDPSLDVLHNYVVHCAYPFEHSPEYERLEHATLFVRTVTGLDHTQRKKYDRRRQLDAKATVHRFLEAWPCEGCPPCSLNPDLYDVANLEHKVWLHFSNRFHNLKLKEHLTRVQMILNNLYSEASSTSDFPSYSFEPSQSFPLCIARPLVVDQLFTRPAPPLVQERNQLPRYAADARHTTLSDPVSLLQLIAVLEGKAENSFQRQYTLALRTSAESFGSEMSFSDHETTKLPTVQTLLEYYTWCRTNYVNALHHLQQHLGPKSYSEQAVEQSGQWPRITAHALFRSIASNSPIILPESWKRCLIRFILLALELQRARRLLLLHYDNLCAELCRELQNGGCDGWDAESYPDWLLIQLEGNFLIRRIQADVANKMMAPQSDENMAMQLNMGEGKTSVIVPIVVAALANGDQLVRVIVPKPLVPQTLHLLTDRLGGLTNRRIYYLPFSRSHELDDQKVASLHQIMLECMQERGILVLQPEHVLSLKLVSVEKQLPRLHAVEEDQVGHLLLNLQRWLCSHSRDVLDESDKILDVRSQLIFTLGDQQQVEGHPERWTTTQQVLALVSERASSLRERFPLGVEYEPGPPGSFPFLRILQADAGEELISRIVKDIFNGHLPNINSGKLHLHSSGGDAIQSFISCNDVSPDTVRLVKECTAQTLLWGGLLLLRGLFANGILSIAFRERRWRVDYGLAPERTMLAVPYRAKDVPSERAEFGHPDVAIILTCISYYYGGLSEEQLNLSFRILLRQHDPSLDYDLWVRAYPVVPESLPTVTGINIDSLEQWNKTLFPLFSRNRATIDFYLSRVVFPREAKEFPSKLSSSGWDLAERKERLVTGFSGTNDGQYLLPIHITQRDPDHQRGTNAKVLSYILQPENNHYMCMVDRNGKQLNINDFLHILVAQTPEIRVLLDVGAQMLDLQNYELAKAWLDITPNASAAIYFSEDDELMVCTRDSSAQLLQSSPFAQQLDRCVVYLDDAHTRGTDIRFPNRFRAAVTLGPKVNKDRLVQGCMRMRKLGHAHSIMFFAPLDVDRHIRVVAGKDEDPSNVIDTMDILHWAIRETWQNIQRWAPHWVQQGMDHASRYVAWTGFCGDQLTSKELLEKWLQPEAKKLEGLYEPRNPSNPSDPIDPDIRQRGVDLGVLSVCSVGLDEEQERELVYEVKREREVERPPSVRPADHSIHQDVVRFVNTGVIPSRTLAWAKLLRARNKAFCPVFETLQTTSAAFNESYVWSQSILATMDFEETVTLEGSGKMDNYLRPVHWIISAKRDGNDVLVVLSSYEVNILLPDIRASNKVHLHLYTPRITRSMKPCDDLTLYTVPAVPIGWNPPSSFMDELSVFAGQLYLKDYEAYIRLCRFLCLHTRELLGEETIAVEPDGFILPVNRAKLKRTQISHTFANTPIVSLKALMNLRNKDIDFAFTHMGKLVHAHLLSKTDFDD